MRTALSMLLMLAVSHAYAVDDFRVIKLEQDVRNLERDVRELSRQVDELSAQLSRAGDRGPSRRTSAPSQPASSSWLVAANWDRIRAGMNELEVIDILGPPSSMRIEDGDRVLLYAMEIGTDGFLSGSVTLRERKVVEVAKPVLK